MSVKAFVDTNVFVYATLQDSDSQQKRMASIAVLSASHRIVVSTQVLNEFSAVLLKNRFSDDDIRARFENIAADSSVALVNLDTIRLAWEVRKRYRLSFWDSLIVASALRTGCNSISNSSMI